MTPKLYLTGSLRNPSIPSVGSRLREMGYEVFDDWFAVGENADDEWQDYEQQRGRSYVNALKGYAANHVFTYDLDHLSEADAVVLIYPAGKSSFLELGWAIGSGKFGYIYMPEEPERWDVMVKFARGIHQTVESLDEQLKRDFQLVCGVACTLPK